jgi:hypothetical protein
MGKKTRVVGIEPTSTILETAILPLNYTLFYYKEKDTKCGREDLNLQGINP